MTIAIILGIVAGLAIAAALFKPFFGDMEGFLECVKFWLMPDIISLFRGEWLEDRWSELKLFLWIVMSGLIGLGVAMGVEKVLM